MPYEGAYADKQKMRDQMLYNAKAYTHGRSAVVEDEIYQKDKWEKTTRRDVMKRLRENFLAQMENTNQASVDAANSMWQEHQRVIAEVQSLMDNARATSLVLLQKKLKRDQAGILSGNEDYRTDLEDTQKVFELQQDPAGDPGILEGLENQFEEDHELAEEPLRVQDTEALHEQVRTAKHQMGELAGNRQERRIQRKEKKNELHTAQKNYKEAVSAQRKQGRVADHLEKALKKQNKTLEKQRELIHKKAEAWDKRRKAYREETFEHFYKQYDVYAQAYRVITRGDQNRAGFDEAKHAKRIMEYRGVFDVGQLDGILQNIKDNPYKSGGAIQVSYWSSKQGNINTGSDVKVHTRSVFMGLMDKNGYQERYKVFTDDTDEQREEKAYKARRQLLKDGTLPKEADRTEEDEKTVIASAEAPLYLDEKTEGGYILSQNNIEIFEQKSGRGKMRTTVNAIYLNGAILTEDSAQDKLFLKMRGDVKTLEEQEILRHAMLKSELLERVNAKNLQYYMGYGAQQSYGAGRIRAQMELGLKEVLDKDPGMHHFYTHLEEEKKKQEQLPERKKDDTKLKGLETRLQERKKIIMRGIENRLFGWNGEDTLVDENGNEDEEVMVYQKSIKKLELTVPVYTKFLYDIYQREKDDRELLPQRLTKKALQDNDSDTMELFRNAPEQAKRNFATLLLSENDQRSWQFASTICLSYLEDSKVFAYRLSRLDKRDEESSIQLSWNPMQERMELLDELTKNRDKIKLKPQSSATQVFLECTKPGRKVEGWVKSGLRIYDSFKEETDNKRGTKAELRQGLVTNGALLKMGASMIGIVNTGMSSTMEGLMQQDEFKNVWGCINVYAGLIATGREMGIANAIPIVAFQAQGDGQHLAKDALQPSLLFGMIQSIKALIGMAQTAVMLKKLPQGPEAKSVLSKRRYYELCRASLGCVLGLFNTLNSMGNNDPEIKKILGISMETIGFLDNCLKLAESIKLQKEIKKEQKCLAELEKASLLTVEENDTRKEQKRKTILNQKIEKAKSAGYYHNVLQLAKRNSERTIGDAAFGIAGNINGIVTKALDSNNLQDPKSYLVRTIGAGVQTLIDGGKMGYHKGKDHYERKDDILRESLNNERALNVSKRAYNHVLKREAGIRSVDYLLDAYRIINGIDTHFNLQNAREGGEQELAVEIAQTLFSHVTDYASVQKISLNQILSQIGFKGDMVMLMRNAIA